MIPFWLRTALLISIGTFFLSPASTSSDLLPEVSSQPCFPLPQECLREGDVILRNGIGIISELFAGCSIVDKTFSHAGILLSTDSGWVVCHALGGEASGQGGLLLDELNVFCSKQVTDTFMVFRLTDDAATRSRVRSYCLRKRNEKVLFDRRFDLTDTSAMYCTELVYRAFKVSSGGSISLPLTSFNGIRYVACDNLYLNCYAKPVQP